jgi:hypothetical protein
MQRVERVQAAKLDGISGDGKVHLPTLVDQPSEYVGTQVTTQGYYFWSPSTSGLLAETVSYEHIAGVDRDLTLGSNPRPAGRIIFLEGFPPHLSSQLNIGPGNSHVWGPVEVTGLFEAGGKWGPRGEHNVRLTISDGKVTVLRR